MFKPYATQGERIKNTMLFKYNILQPRAIFEESRISLIYRNLIYNTSALALRPEPEHLLLK